MPFFFDGPPPAIIIPEKPAIIRPGDPGFVPPGESSLLLSSAKKRGASIVTVASPSGKKQDGDASDGSGTTRSFTSFDFDTAAANRQIFAAVVMNNTSGSPELSSVTIGGVSAAILGGQLASDSKSGVYIVGASVPTGTSGDVDLTFDENIKGAAVAIWIVTGASLTAHDTAGEGTTPSPLAGSIDCAAGGAIFAAQGIRSSFSGSSSWTGVTDNEHAQFSAGVSSSRRGAAVAQAFDAEQESLSVESAYTNGTASGVSALWVSVSPA